MVLITPLLYPFVCENYGIKRHHIVKEQMTTAGKSAPTPIPLASIITITNTGINY